MEADWQPAQREAAEILPEQAGEAGKMVWEGQPLTARPEGEEDWSGTEPPQHLRVAVQVGRVAVPMGVRGVLPVIPGETVASAVEAAERGSSPFRVAAGVGTMEEVEEAEVGSPLRAEVPDLPVGMAGNSAEAGEAEVRAITVT